MRYPEQDTNQYKNALEEHCYLIRKQRELIDGDFSAMSIWQFGHYHNIMWIMGFNGHATVNITLWNEQTIHEVYLYDIEQT